ncbi:Kelch repeat-containing protein [Cavenderia fasciculata]|uniref:Kelch repeat-containing protein n=1 Tax=Cavenderia fasciculata TaxID=261658 RepID=F4QDM0_CACFS|nr:Kelch repeat-containing protein [Cavenderia fasciculata]EGG13817.1 Kelch repeat-containing protein [Cavenderia fasciculata]|eukprot:XP_004350525.1 Kelch repeat-containing protein [Cavenderia fasciculata]
MGIPQQEDNSFTPNGWKLVPTHATPNPSGTKPMEIDQQVTFITGVFPIERHGHTTCLYKNTLILFGGTPDGSSGLNDLYFLNLDNFTWVEVKTKGISPIGRYRHSAIIIEDKMYVFGGYRSKCLNDLHTLDLKTLTWSEPPQQGDTPTARSSHAVCSVGKKMILFGGSGARYSNELFTLNTVTNRWTKHEVTGTPPSERWCHTICSFGKKVYAFGGSNDKKKDNKVFILDTETFEWTQPPTSGVSPSPRQLHTAVSIGESMIVFGGWGRHQELNDLYILNTRTMRWTCPKIETLIPCCRQLHSAWVYNGKMYVLGGYSKSKRMNDVFCFSPEQTVSSLRDLCIEKIVDNISNYVDYFPYLPDELLFYIFTRLAQSGKPIPLKLDRLIQKSYLAEYATINSPNFTNTTFEETLQYHS